MLVWHPYLSTLARMPTLLIQILQLSRPPSLPPISEMARPELKLAGMRIDPDMFSRSKMGYNLDMAIVDSKQVCSALMM